MCCRTSVQPLDKLIAETVLMVGQFQRRDSGKWEREIPEEGTTVSVWLSGDGMELSLNPSVASMDQHHQKRLAAGVMYSIADAYASKVGGTVKQTGINIPQCASDGTTQRLIAQYPERRIDFSALCVGWQTVFVAGTGEGDEIIATG